MKVLIVFMALVSLAQAQKFSYRDAMVDDLSKPVSINISGEKGENGYHGSDGHSSCDGVTDSNFDNNGGDAGDGGDGEDGGDAYVHYTELSELKNLRFISRGGEGGRGGLGGTGVTSCAYSGGGSDGRDGRDGKPGRAGSLYLIRKPLQYEENAASKSVKLGQLSLGQTFLSESVWKRKSAGQALLREGSDFSGTYYELENLFRKRIILNWQSLKELKDYKNEEFGLRLSTGSFSLSPRNLLVEHKIEESQTEVIVTVFDIINKTEVLNFSEFSSKGSGKEIFLSFEDNGIFIPGLEKKIHLSVHRSRSLGSDVLLLKRMDAQSYLKFDGKKCILDVSALPFEDEYKTKGSKIIVELDIEYSVGSQSFMRNLIFAYKVGQPGSRFERVNSNFEN